MVSTRNTSRSNTNPLRMQDPSGDADSRPPDALEILQANTDKVEALRLTNQRLTEELEQLTRQMRRPRRRDRFRKAMIFPLMMDNTISALPEGSKQKQKSNRTEPESSEGSPAKMTTLQRFISHRFHLRTRRIKV